MIPIVRPKSPVPAPERQSPAERSCAYQLARVNTRFAAKTMADTVYSATGTAFACAADETVTPWAKTAGSTCPFTDPAAWITARSRGAVASTALSMRGHPQPVTSTSTSRSTDAASSVPKDVRAGPGFSRTRVRSRSSRSAGNRSGSAQGCMASTATGRSDTDGSLREALLR
jgi:hypothetical protein